VLPGIALETAMKITIAIVTLVSGALPLALARTAAAAPPAWCKDASVGRPDLGRLSSKDAGQVIKTLVAAECAPTPEVEAHRSEIAAARQAWSRRLGMTEPDWADAVAYAAFEQSHRIEGTLSTEVLASATPLDQYAIIAGVLPSSAQATREIDAMYAADMFEPNLSELGRYAFLDAVCFDASRSVTRDPAGLLGTEVPWAICQADFERFDLTRLFNELRADTAHDGALKMKLRLAVYEFPQRIKDHAAEVQQMLAHDPGNRAVFEVAAKARAGWSSGVGKNAGLLALVQDMETAQRTQSRKLLAGCGPRTAAALAEAASTLPASAFAGMRDDRDDPVAGFASRAGVVLVSSPAVNLAAIAFTLCAPESGTSELLRASLHAGPGLRGPRNAALAAIKDAKIEYDRANAVLRYPAPKPYGAGYPPASPGRLGVHSRGGVVRSVKRSGDTLTVATEKIVEKVQSCVASRSTGRVSRVRDDGSVEYERVCTRSGTVAHDRTWEPFELPARYATWLTPGAVFSVVGGDVIAVWPSKTAKTPSMVLGGPVK
jgi:hypothetical protein